MTDAGNNVGHTLQERGDEEALTVWADRGDYYAATSLAELGVVRGKAQNPDSSE